VRRGAVVLAALAAVAVLPAAAFAQFRDASAAALPVATASLTAPTGVTSTCVAKGSVQVSWTAVADARSYQVYQRENNSSFTLVTTVAAPATSVTLTVPSNKDVTHKVVATAGPWVGPESALSNTVRCN
jgi:hypothetical protein